MAYQQILLQSQQSGPFTPQNNNVDVVIPDYIQASDLSQSCIVLDMELMNGSTPLGLYDAEFANSYQPRVMVRNCKLTSDKAGTLEEIQSSNVLTSNLQQLQQDFETAKSNVWKGQGGGPGATTYFGSFVLKRNTGNQLSQQRTYFKIPLKDIFGLGSMSQFPNGKFGNTTIHLEFEDDANKISKLYEQIINQNAQACNDVASDSTQLVLTNAIPNATAFQYYVGQPITVTRTVGGSAGTQDTIITSISVSSANIVTVTVANTIVASTAVSFVAKNSGVANSSLSYRINQVQLLLYSVKLSSAQNENMDMKLKKGVSMPYTTYHLERVNVNQVGANLTYDRQFEIEPNCMNAMIITPIVSQDDPFISRRDNLEQYRFNLNGIDTTNRDIVPYAPLYYDRVIASSASGNLKLNNLILNRGTNSETSTLILPQPIPLIPRFQTLQLHAQQNSNASNSNKILHLFKQVQKELKLTNSGVQVA